MSGLVAIGRPPPLIDLLVCPYHMMMRSCHKATAGVSELGSAPDPIAQGVTMATYRCSVYLQDLPLRSA
jgi:hypothetical protein